ncbi:carcinine transporter-like [Schistocerca cancellata]|uniref:carcinine transporter-like n=1 Tax=Schistocerca cancellata TaxID=274614 RepID=UPI002118EC5E|nr:carcinine transporter-like [Schistocerca cancellata]
MGLKVPEPDVGAGDARRRSSATQRLQEAGALLDGLIAAIGSRGRFQTRFNLIFNLCFLVLAAMPPLNYMIAMSVPDHWCHVPGRELTNYSLDEWKALTIPRVKGESAFEHCLQYNVSWEYVDGLATPGTGNESAVVECQHGVQFDDTWYTRTVPSQERWVCGERLKVANAFAVHQVGHVVGGFMFCQLGDYLGRRPQFFLSMVLASLARSLLVVTSSIYPLFLVVSILGGAPIGAVFEAPLALSMEVSDSERRGHIAMMQLVGWSTGMCIVPLVAWACRDWVPFMLITSLPSLGVVFFFRMFPESPRWLAAKGRTHQCLSVLRHIAKVNGRSVPHGAMDVLERIAAAKERHFGIAGLFSSARIIRNTVMISLCRISGFLTFYVLVLNVSNMSGNPYLNFLYQALVEVPGFVMGRYLGDWLGRRWTQAGSQWVMALANFTIVIILTFTSVSWPTTVLVVFIRFGTTIVNYIAYLQSMELYPTCIRQTGTSFGMLAAGALAAVAPYVVHLGSAYDPRLPYAVLGATLVVGGLLASFLPETLHCQLPETLRDAQVFGSDEKYWSFRPHKPPAKGPV